MKLDGDNLFPTLPDSTRLQNCCSLDTHSNFFFRFVNTSPHSVVGKGVSFLADSGFNPLAGCRTSPNPSGACCGIVQYKRPAVQLYPLGLKASYVRQTQRQVNLPFLTFRFVSLIHQAAFFRIGAMRLVKAILFHLAIFYGSKQTKSRTASDMDVTLNTDLAGFENIRDIKKVL